MRGKGKKERERKEIIKRKKKRTKQRDLGIDNFIRKLDDHLVLYSKKYLRRRKEILIYNFL